MSRNRSLNVKNIFKKYIENTRSRIMYFQDTFAAWWYASAVCAVAMSVCLSVRPS